MNRSVSRRRNDRRNRDIRGRRLLFEPLEQRRLLACDATPTATLVDVPAEPLLGSQATFTVRFDNTSATDTGFGPYADLYLPATGADGSTVGAPNDGITYVSSSFLGNPISPDVLAFGPDSNGNGIPDVEHPFAKDATGALRIVDAPAGFFEGDQLVVFETPFGSFAPDQPPAEVEVTVQISTLAHVDKPLPIQVQGGFQFGCDALDNPTTDAPILGPMDLDSVQPTVVTLEKTYQGPEDETATGPNYPRTYIITVDIADGQTLTDFVLTERLPNSVVFLPPVSATPGGYTILQQPNPPGAPYNPPANDVVLKWNSVTGGSGGSDVQIVLQFYVPADDADGNPTVPCGSGDGKSINDVFATGHWIPADPRDPEEDVSVGATDTEDHVLDDKCLATQKNVVIAVDNGAPGLTPDDILEYTIDFQISDYFAFENVLLTDVYSDGQELQGVPTLEVHDGHGTPNPYGPTDFLVANYTLSPTAGPDTLTMRVSAELDDRNFSPDGRLVGGGIPDGGSQGNPLPPSPPYGGTKGTVKFRTIVLNEFGADTTPKTQNVDHGDKLDNDVTLSGGVLAVEDLAPTGKTAEDNSDSEISIIVGELSKSIYALNGSTSLPSPLVFAPGDELTYRIQYTLSSSDIEDLQLVDYLPQPTFDATEVTTFTAVVDGSVPAAGEAKFGPADTFYAVSSIVPGLSSETVSNTLTFDYGDHADDQNRPTEIDILFTVTVSAAPAADRLKLTNQVQSTEGSTNSGPTSQEDIIIIELGQPVIDGIKKGVVATDNPNGMFQPTPVGPVSFSDPTDAGAPSPRFSGTINSAGLAANPIDSNLSNIDAQDLVTFAITVENTGSSRKGAFDVFIRDTLPAGFETPGIGSDPDGINLQVTDGAGNPIPFTYFTNTFFGLLGGIQLVDPPGGAMGALGPGVVGGSPVTDGSNIAIITYDLRTIDTHPLDTITNTATLTNYAGAEGGPDHTGLDDPTDDAFVIIANADLNKELVETEIEDANNERREAVVGELITYRVTVTIPEGITPGAVLTDRLDIQLGFVEQVSVDVPAGVTIGGSTTPTVSADRRDVTWNLGDITNGNDSNDVPEKIVFTYTVLPLNTADTNANDSVYNWARFTFTGLSNPLQDRAPTVQILEPQPSVDKSVITESGSDTGDAGDLATYTIVLSNPPQSDEFTADAFDVTFSDPLPTDSGTGASLIENPTFTVTDTPAPGVVDASYFQLVGSNAGGWTLESTQLFDLLVDATREITITIQGTISRDVSVGDSIVNEAMMCWTSLPGPTVERIPGNPDSTERTGDGNCDTDSVNDYCTCDDAVIMIDNPVLNKTLVTTSETASPLPNRVVIGEIVRYRLKIRVPESHNLDVDIQDRIPDGLLFLDDGTATIAFVSTILGNLTSSTIQDPSPGVFPELDLVGDENTVDSIVPEFPIPPNVILPPPDGNDLIIYFGTFQNTESDSNGEFVIVEFNVLVTNTVGNQESQLLPNDFLAHANGTETDPSPSADVIVAEPEITGLSKSTDPAGPFDAGDTVNYAVEYHNGIGANVSFAYDARLTDTLPAAQMTLVMSSIEVFRNNVEIFTGFTNDSAGNTVDITVDRVGEGVTIRVEYDAVLTELVGGCDEIINTVDVTYTSLPGPNGTTTNPTGSANTGTPGSETGERDGSGGINDYFLETSHTIDLLDPHLSKSITDTTINETTSNQFDPNIIDLAIGEIAIYTIIIVLPEGTTELKLEDQVPAGMQILASEVISIGSNISGSALNAGDSGTPTGTTEVEFDFGTVLNVPDNVVDEKDLITVEIVAQVLNEAVNVAGRLLTNTATLTFGNCMDLATANAEVVEPKLEIVKEVVEAGTNPPQPGDDTLDADDIVTYRATLRHDLTQPNPSTAIAYNIEITDTLPDSLELLSAQIVYVPAYQSVFWTLPVLTTSGNTVTLTADWLDHPDSPISAGILDEIVIEYTARVKGPPEANAAAPCEGIENTATVNYDSYFRPSDQNPDISRPYTDDDVANITINCNAIEGVIYVDLNNNGVYEPGAGETLITESVTMHLTGTDHLGNPVDRTLTTTTGMYAFDLLRPSDANSYTVTQVNQPAGYVDGKDTHGTPFGGTDTQGGDLRDAEQITTIVIPLDSNTTGVDYNFGELPPARIADFVWEDLNGDGIQDAGEPGLDGVAVDLAGTDTSGNAITRSTTTAGGGLYEFADLRPGDYVVTFTLLTGFLFTKQNAGTDDTKDSDADRNTGASPTVTVGVGEDNPTIDAGMLVLGSIHGYKFEDFNGDGSDDPPDDTRWSSVEITLTGDVDGDGTPDTLTDTTGANGEYGFTDLYPGPYTITETVPAGSAASTPATYTVTVNSRQELVGEVGQSGVPTDVDDPRVEVLVAPELIFGNSYLGSIHGYKFEDINGDGLEDATDPRLAGVVITLTGDVDNDGTPDTVTFTTDANGEYAFTGLFPGPYTITETPPAGSVATVPDSYNVTVNSRQELVAEDGQAGIPPGGNDPRVEVLVYPELVFGNTFLGSIHGYKFEDVNGDGVEDATDSRLPGVVITLTGDVDGDGTPDTQTFTTDANGEYAFTALYPGQYTITETPPAGSVPVTATSYNVTVESGKELVAEDGQANIPPTGDPREELKVYPDLVFGNTFLGSIHGYKFEDINGNRAEDVGDPRLAGVVITLEGDVDGDGTPDTVTFTTDANGEYAFTALYPGQYTITETPPAGSVATIPGPYTVTVDSRKELVAEDGQAGITDPDDPRVEDNVAPELIFGNTFLGSIHGYKFEDMNGNGIEDTGDPRLQGVVIALEGDVDGDGTSDTRTFTTDATGEYDFTDLYPGQYTITETVPPDSIATTVTTYTVTVDSRQELVAEAGQANIPAEGDDPRVEVVVGPELVFGNGFLMSIGDFVWYDINGDGVQDAGEPGIPGATVTVTWHGPDGQPGGGDDVVYNTTTDANGLYQIDDLPPGSYEAEVTGLPNGLTTQTYDPSPFALQSGTDNFDIDFGFTAEGTIGDLVWYDVDEDGTNVGEPGIAGVTVDLIWFGFDGVEGTPDDVHYPAATTDANGNYLFDRLPFGDFRVTVDASTLPSLLVPTYDLDSGLNNPDGTTTVSLTPANPDEDGADFGYTGIPSFGNRIWLDYNGDGVQDANEPGLNGVEVTATWAGPDGDLNTPGDNVTLVTTTNTGGLYLFAALPTGLWRAEVTGGLPPGVTNTGDPDGTLDSRTEFTLGPIDVRLDIDFGYQGNSSLSGYVYRDFDIDGIREPGAVPTPETGIGGITVTLTGTDVAGNAVNQVMTTATDGSYFFPGLIPGDYVITETQPLPFDQPGGFYDGLDTVGTISGTQVGTSPSKNVLAVTLDVDQQGVEYNFGENPPGSVLGFVYIDLNLNGSRDPGEPGIPNVDVTVSGTAFPGTPLQRPLTAAEVGGGSLVVQTDASGQWLFPQLPPGEVQLVETQPAGYVDGDEENAETFPAPPVTIGNDVFSNVLLYPVKDRGPLNYGEIAIDGRLAGSVYVDKNNDGFRDPGEPGIPGVTVQLTGTDLAGSPVAADVVTDANGEFAFERMLPGTYDLPEIHPTAFLDGKDRAGSLGGQAGNDIITGIPLGPNEKGVDYLFGELGWGDVSKRCFLTTDPLCMIVPDPGPGVTIVNPLPDESPAMGPYDVNQDGYVTPTDVLRIVNLLNGPVGTAAASGPEPAGLVAPSGESGPEREDVNGDGVVTPQDALIVINYLNGLLAAPVGEGESYESPSLLSAQDTTPLDRSLGSQVDAAASPMDPVRFHQASESARVEEKLPFSPAEESLAEDELLSDVLDVLALDVAGQWLLSLP